MAGHEDQLPHFSRNRVFWTGYFGGFSFSQAYRNWARKSRWVKRTCRAIDRAA